MLVVSLFVLFLFSCEVGSVTVQVEQGLLEGEQLDLVTGDGKYFSFKGIPYAAPPVGDLRFKPPKPFPNWKGVRNTTEHGSVCIQYDSLEKKAIFGSEDCLFLNIYTPDLIPDVPLPVMVFIHGGGYETGSGDADNYGPDFIVQNRVILVTFNYRLEVLGFLSLDTEDVPGNAGMKDQVAALNWVQKSIRKFGGDPDNVTLFGQSSGSASAILHVVSPMSKGLFKRVIAMSGVPSCDWSIPFKPARRAFVLGKQLGNDTENPKGLFEFLKKVPAVKLVNVEPNILSSEDIISKNYKMFHFTPVVEKDYGQERFLSEEPEKIIRDGTVNSRELIIGRTSEEALIDVLLEDIFLANYPLKADLLVPRKILYKTPATKIFELSDKIKNHYFGTKPISKNTMRELITYLNDSIYGYDIYRYIQMFLRIPHTNVYVYRFSGVSERNIYGRMATKYSIIGASHLDDLAYLFDPKSANLNLKRKSKDYKIITNISKLFTDFAKFGNPTPGNNGTSWPVHNTSTDAYMDISDELRVGKELDRDVAGFWKTIYEDAGINFDFFEKLYG